VSTPGSGSLSVKDISKTRFAQTRRNGLKEVLPTA
jgi:hypothetical protein